MNFNNGFRITGVGSFGNAVSLNSAGNITGISAGSTHNLALLKNGQINIVWPDNYYFRIKIT